MASPQLIPRLDPSKPLFVPTTPDFAGTVQQILGDLGTGSDGWDAIFAVPAGAIDADTAALSELDALIFNFDFEEGAFAKVYHTPVDAALPGFLANGDVLNAAVQNLGEVQGPTTITPSPPPPKAIRVCGYKPFQFFADQTDIMAFTVDATPEQAAQLSRLKPPFTADMNGCLDG